MKQAMTLFLCACALPTALLLPHARAEGVITLKSGEKLPGSMDTMNRPYLNGYFSKTIFIAIVGKFVCLFL